MLFHYLIFIIMNKDVLKQNLLSKSLLWQDIFLTMFLRNHGLLESDLNEKSYDVTICFKFCRNEDDYEDMWTLLKFVDDTFDCLKIGIDTFCIFKSVAWQYDFVSCISRICNINIVQSLSAQSVIIAYCWMLMLPTDLIKKLLDNLDARHANIISSMANKESKLKRNLLLTLECGYGQRLYGSIDSFTFREIIDEYVSVAGVENVVNMLKSAKTAETQLSDDEIDCQSFAYYSPFFEDEINLSRNLPPQGNLFQQVYEYMFGTSRLWQSERQKAVDDEDYEVLTEVAVYVDPTEMCLIDVHMDENFYANVYIKRKSQDDMFNLYSDFIVYNGGFLYTVEFVEDFDITPYTKEFVNQLAQSKQELQKVQEKLDKLSPEPSKERSRYLQKQEDLCKYIYSCYYVFPS